eukprot:GHVN01033745.1.p2 GENE.GHVN01033745.1~~GHVN01033745.1.p2  ORF type:complete len:110 (+),score=16.61 GHVN01033745.1:732-1061(+)
MGGCIQLATGNIIGGTRLTLGQAPFSCHLWTMDECDVGLMVEILKYADDTKLFSLTLRNTNPALQIALNKVVEWAKDSLMEFSFTKCKSLHFGQNEGAMYMMGEHTLQQ